MQLCFTAPPEKNRENIDKFTKSTEALIIFWKGGAEGKGESVTVDSHAVFK